MPDQARLARLPKVDQIIESGEMAALSGEIARPLLVKAARQTVEELRARLLADAEVSEEELCVKGAAALAIPRARLLALPSLRRVVNATGVVVHTNLGRSLLAPTALKRVTELSQSYSNLEYDLEAGHRGSRYVHVIEILKEITGAEGVLVVNNNAAAVFLCLMTFASGKEVIVSRGQLVEIGGSFRIPDVMSRSGAVLREVGTTNKTHLRDYENAICSQTGMLLKVHTSNYAIVGFTKEVPLSEMAELGKRYGLPVMEDLGSGTLIDFSQYGLKPAEPTVGQALAAGADLLTFSGDKLLGGPQAGVILGKAEMIDALRSNPVNRALRIDKMTLAALEATLELYREPKRALREIPTLAMITITYEELRKKADSLARALNAKKIPGLLVTRTDGISRVGGGAMPLASPMSRLLEISIRGMSPTRLERGLREHATPIICRMEDGRLLMDMRTISDKDRPVIIEALSGLAG